MMCARTRPDVKWLINEAAAMAGELMRLDTEIARLTELRASTYKTHAACVRTLSVITGPLTSADLPTVLSHRTYGGRGSLRQFLKDTLKSAAPAALDTNELSFQAIDKFNLTFSGPPELRRFQRNSIGRALRALEKSGIVEPVGERWKGKCFGKWRWVETAPSLEDLAELADCKE